jgi:hypothetical protein
MRRKHRTRFCGNDPKYPKWGESLGHRRWHIEPISYVRYTRRVSRWTLTEAEANDFSDVFDTPHRMTKRMRTETAAVYAWGINVERRGMMDDFGALKSSKFTEWRGGSPLCTLYHDHKSAWRRMREWGLRVLPDWSGAWDVSWRDPKCVGDFAYWVSRVVSSRWWIERVGFKRRYVLAPVGVSFPEDKGWIMKGKGWYAGDVLDSTVLYVHRHECNGWDMMMKMLTDGRNKNSLPSFKALIAFTARFWGEEIAEDLGREFRKVFPATLCC